MGNEVISLYQRNLSGPEIARRLRINTRSVYRILDRAGIKRRSSSEQNRLNFIGSPLSFNFKKRLSAKENELMIAGAMLYYGEGAKTGQTVDLANADPKILKIFLKFLRRICGVDEGRLRFYLYCFSDQDEIELIDFWSRELNVPKKNFTRPYIRKTGRLLSRRMRHGVLHIRYSDSRLLDKILGINSTFFEKL